jgi:hypothetical protein
MSRVLVPTAPQNNQTSELHPKSELLYHSVILLLLTDIYDELFRKCPMFRTVTTTSVFPGYSHHKRGGGDISFFLTVFAKSKC